MLESVSYDIASGFGSRVIKRYSNRKLYDTRSSRYVTLLQIAQMVRSGEEVQIIDNRTKEDKTEVTLALIISEELKNSPGGIPLTTLKALIRHDSTPPPSGEQPTFAGARLLGLLGVSEVNVRRDYAVAEDRATGAETFVGAESFAGAGAFAGAESFAGAGAAEQALTGQESSMNDPLQNDPQRPRPEGGRAGLDSELLEAVRPDGGPRQAERSPFDPLDSRHNEQRLEQWRTELEARVKSLVGDLPDSRTVTDLQGRVEQLDQRVAELEQRLSKREE